ncbi:MAG: hypothetical protein RIF41_19720 [Polyangiaceae bacterium]
MRPPSGSPGFDFAGAGSDHQRTVVLRRPPYSYHRGNVQLLFIVDDRWKAGQEWSQARPLRPPGADRDALLDEHFHEVAIGTCPNGHGPKFLDCYPNFRAAVPELLFLVGGVLNRSPDEARPWYEQQLSSIQAKAKQPVPASTCPIERAKSAVVAFYLARNLGKTIPESLQIADEVMGPARMTGPACTRLAKQHVVPELDADGFPEGTRRLRPRIHTWAEIRAVIKAAEPERADCRDIRLCQLRLGVTPWGDRKDYANGSVVVP